MVILPATYQLFTPYGFWDTAWTNYTHKVLKGCVVKMVPKAIDNYGDLNYI